MSAPKSTVQETPASCYHCGQPCQEETLQAHQHTFCCVGCQSVYEILHEHNLGAYYNWEPTPGASQTQYRSTSFTYLDEPGIAEELYTFHEGVTAQVKFFLPAIHCSSCIWLLEHLDRLHPGVQRSRVNFVKKEAQITFQPEIISLRELADLLAKIGYRPEINLQSGPTSANAERKLARNRALQTGVAGFCFGNIMLLSLPEYIEGGFGIDPAFARFFGYLNLLLALPVVLYSGRDYLKAAWTALRQRHLSLDVPIALGILVLFGRSTFEVLTQAGAGYFDSLAGLIFFLLIGRWFQAKTYQALSFERDYRSYFPLAITVLADGEEFSVPLKNIQRGDTILVRHQEIIPADAELLSPEAHIDYSFITGESDPVPKQINDRIQAGGRQVGPAIRLKVIAPVAQSTLTQLWNQQPTESAEKLPDLMDRVSRYFTWAILALAAVAGLVWAWVDASQVAPVITAILIVACPCALALTLPFAYGHALRWLGRWGLYLKNATVVERMAELAHLIFDKTGTITHAQDFQFTWVGQPLSADERAFVRALARQSNHPLSRALYQGISTEQAMPQLYDFEELPGLGITGFSLEMDGSLGSAAFMGYTTTQTPEGQVTYLKLKGELKGYFLFRTRYREGYQPLLWQLAKDYTLHLLSGDEDKDREKLAPYFSGLSFRQSPQAKKAYLESLAQSQQKAGMVGDGLNDAGALRAAHVGISLAENVHHFAPACDAILGAEALPQLPAMLRFARQTRRVVYLAMGISFLYNGVGLTFALLGLLTPLVAAILMPLSSITTVAFITLAINRLARKVL